MVKSTRVVVEKFVFLEWIEVYDNAMRCARCDSWVRLEKPDTYEDGIPRIELPHDWFRTHSNSDHKLGDWIAPDPQPDPKPLPQPDPKPLPEQPILSLFAPPSEPKSPPPIPYQDALILRGSDACRLLCGADRQEVLARRRAILAGTEEESETVRPLPALVQIAVKPMSLEFSGSSTDARIHEVAETMPVDDSWLALARSTYINVFNSVIWIRFDERRVASVPPHGSIWLPQETFHKQPQSVRSKLAVATRVPSLINTGMLVTPQLRVSMGRCGMLVSS